MALDTIKVNVDQIRSGEIRPGEIASGRKNAHHTASGEITFHGIDIIKKTHEKPGSVEARAPEVCRSETAVLEIVVIEFDTGEVKTGKITALQYLVPVNDFLYYVTFIVIRSRMMLPA